MLFRSLAVEHQLYPEALRLFADGRVKINGRCVEVTGDYPIHRPIDGG